MGRAEVEIECLPGLEHIHHEGSCGRLISFKAFTEEEKESSTWKELKSLFDQYIESNSDYGDVIVHLTDNKAVESIMEKGSPKEHLQEMALRIYRKFQDAGRVLDVMWVRRSDPRLVFADDHSRALDLDDWSVDEATFKELQSRAGPFDTDLFASDLNKRLGKYFSKMPSDGALGRDAFLANWSSLGKVFACPAPKEVAAVMRKFVRDQACGGLIVPKWVSLYGWHLLCEDGVHLNRVVSSVRMAWPYVSKGPQVTSNVFSGFTSFPFLSLKINGKVDRPFESKIRKAFCVNNGCTKCT